jgi:hypothetical protein
MRTFNPEIDHIDPQWKEGRDYQLVCGLDLPINYAEVSREYNTSKSNRFLPYRVTSDGLGCVPVTTGDLCLFLDPDNQEWVLEEFLGEWWYTKTNQYAGGCIALDKWRESNLEAQVANLVSWQRANAGETTRKQWEFYRENSDKLQARNDKIGQSASNYWKANPDAAKARSLKIEASKRRNRGVREADD